MRHSRSNRAARFNSLDPDNRQMLHITQRCSLKSYATHKRLSQYARNVTVKSLFARAGELYLEIYGLLARALPAHQKPPHLTALPDFNMIRETESDQQRLQKAASLDDYTLSLLRLVITRIDDDEIKHPLSSKIASLQIVHDRVKELQA